ncbi:hypothetical protein XENORESO_000003 [Xenotaenia resolanae]|uniref:Uncharacterized protein n=1 Tax=Xenotaenia resolanae TaxID=208358 RepID=A0ABV0W9X1_9TELE
MLRSTGFFRGIDCPFYADYDDGKDGRNGCNRPYCHFRHSRQSRPSYGDVKKLLSGQKDWRPVQGVPRLLLEIGTSPLGACKDKRI